MRGIYPEEYAGQHLREKEFQRQGTKRYLECLCYCYQPVRSIIYENDFPEDIDAYTFGKWGSIGVLAHEMGHHYYNDVVSSSGSTPPKEIEANTFSGYVMAKLGASLQQSIASDKASCSHPGNKDRVDAITKGWNFAAVTNTSPANPPNPIATIPAPTNPANDRSRIGLTIQSNKTEIVLLSDDGKNFHQAEITTGEPFTFKFELYNYGWLRLEYYNGYRTFKLSPGKNYIILSNRRTSNWTVTEVPDQLVFKILMG